MRDSTTVNRVELVAALLQYDDDEDESDLNQALSSAILTPYRHVLSRRSQSENQEEGYFDLYRETGLRGAEDEEVLGDDRQESPGTEEQKRYTRNMSRVEALEGMDENQLNEEWGLSQIGSHDELVKAMTTSDHDVLSSSALESPPILNEEIAAPPLITSVRLKILERPRVTSTETSSSSLELPVIEPTDSINMITTAESKLTNARRRSAGLSSMVSLPLEYDSAARSRSSLSPTPLNDYASSGLPSPHFTSRFDPSMQASVRQELERNRPVFMNKDAGAGGKPKVVTMPTPLANAPKNPRAIARVRTEGPDPEGPESESEEEEDVIGRPAGALYGRSLLDVLNDRKTAAKSRSRQYTGKSNGPDLVYAKDMEKMKAKEEMEAETKRKELEAEEVAREAARTKADKKKNRLKKGRSQQLENLVIPAKQYSPVDHTRAALPTVDLHHSSTDEWFAASVRTSLSQSSSTELFENDIHVAHILPPLSPLSPIGKRPQLVSNTSHQHRLVSSQASILHSNKEQVRAWTSPDRVSIVDADDEALVTRLQRPSLVPLDLTAALSPFTSQSPSNFELDADEREAEDEDEDDIPLGRQHPQAQADREDDVPLALRRFSFEGDEDDQPLAYSHAGAAHLQQQHAFQQQLLQQQQHYFEQQQLQNYQYSQRMMNGGGVNDEMMYGGMQNQPSSGVDRWRRGVTGS